MSPHYKKTWLWKALRVVFDAVIEGMDSVFFRQHYLIHTLSRGQIDLTLAVGLRIVEYTSVCEDVLACYRRAERYDDNLEQKLTSRFDHGLRFYALYDGETLWATVWVVPEPRRFFDEAGCYVMMHEDGIWLRDIFVLKQHRGRGVYSKILTTLMTKQYPHAQSVWTSVEIKNTASMRAHRKLGFRVVASVQVIQFFRLVMIRIPSADYYRELTLSGYKNGKRIFFTGRAYRRFVERHMA